MSIVWVERNVDEEKANKLQKETDLSILTTRLLVSRGIETPEQAKAFLYPNFKEGLHNPSSLQEIDIAVQRINQAIENDENVLIHGDYDADGVTTISIYVKGFALLGKKVDFFAPNRFNDGYGINIRNCEKFAKYDLIISGDTGIKAFDAAYELTNTYKTDLIVTDHHEPVVFPIEEESRIPEKTRIIKNEHEVMGLPVCFATINPKRIDCQYPSKDLSGAGVAFKVMEAVFDSRKHPKRELYQVLDYVACGLVPDLVPHFDVNRNTFEVRNLVKLGLSIMNNNPKIWVNAVQNRKENKKPRAITSTDLGFTYGPLLNAAGRLYDPTPAADFLLEEDEEKMKDRIYYLDEVNEERKKLSADTTKAILKEMKELPTERVDYGIVVISDDLHVGITGLVAGNILSEYYRTTIALGKFQNHDGSIVYKGSARSIVGISVLDALIDVEKEMGPYVYGGHEQAAGLTLKPEQIEPFIKHFREACKKQVEGKEEEIFEPKKFYDLNLKLEDVTFSFLREFEAFEPFGMGNEEPIFFVENVYITNVNPIMEGKGIQFDFLQDGTRMKGITFSKGKEIMEKYDDALDRHTRVPCELLGYPQINEWNGKVEFQFVVKDIKIEPSR